MKCFRIAIKYVLPLLLVIACVATASVWISSGDAAIPENPLLQEMDSAHMLLSGGGELKTSENSLSAELLQEHTGDIQQDASEENLTEPESLEQEDKQSDFEHTVSGETGNFDLQKPGETQQASGEKTDTVYFTTSILDGQTVQTRDYSFTISHKQKELTVVSETVYVNGVKQVQFHGNILLEEGENTVRVAVQYRDRNGKVVTAFCDYTVYANLGSIVFVTDLADGQTESDRLQFTATATYNGKQIPLTVTLNGEPLSGGGIYSATLKNGKNDITLFAQNGAQSAERTYMVTCTAPDTLAVYTTLTDCTVHTDIIDFTAYILNGSPRQRLTVTVNGNTLLGENEVYTAALRIGDNVIRLKATDKVNGETVTVDRRFVVKMVPIADEKTAPSISYINVTDGMSIVGGQFMLDIGPVDYLGNRIYDTGITVSLNGVIYQNQWTSEYTGYLLYLKDGQNKLDIRITDGDGRYADYSYTLDCRIPQQGEKTGTLTFCMDANVLGLGTLLSEQTVDILQGESGAELLCRVLRENGFEVVNKGTAGGFYIERISKPGIAQNVQIPQELKDAINADGLEWNNQHFSDSLGEFDYCRGAGWMYQINGKFPNYGFSDAVFQNGDTIKLRFTLAYGKDIGGFDVTGGGSNYDKIW